MIKYVLHWITDENNQSIFCAGVGGAFIPHVAHLKLRVDDQEKEGKAFFNGDNFDTWGEAFQDTLETSMDITCDVLSGGQVSVNIIIDGQTRTGFCRNSGDITDAFIRAVIRALTDIELQAA